MEHREDLLPVARRPARVEDVAVGQRVAVLGAGVHRVAIVDRARAQESSFTIDSGAYGSISAKPQ
jgi:hypothetical protein